MIVFMKKFKFTSYILKYVKSNNRWPRKIEIKLMMEIAFEEVRRTMRMSTSSKEDFNFICRVK